MCFSPEASFTASAVLATVGTVSMVEAKNNKMRWLAIIPLVFSVQQAIEGLQWLAPKPSTISTVLGYGFLFFAFLFWIVAIPAIANFIEPQKGRKKWLHNLTWLGIGGAFCFLAVVLSQPLNVCVVNRSISYQLTSSSLFYFYGLAGYALITCGSLIISSYWRVKVFGATALAGLALTLIFYRTTTTSVWCFFAAVLSVLILWQILHDAKSPENKK